MSDQAEQSYHHGNTCNGKQKRQKGPQETANLKGKAVPSLSSYRTACVLFVEQTRGVNLAKEMKTALERLTPMLGFRMRVVERG